jgi:Xaa-Pro aminopeptidase
MKITLSPISSMIAKAEARINAAHSPNSQDLAHNHKRLQAQAVVAGGTPSAEFQQAAQIEGVTVETLAKTIVSKPDALMARENLRRAAIVDLRKAKSPTDIDKVLQAHQITKAGFVGTVLGPGK